MEVLCPCGVGPLSEDCSCFCDPLAQEVQPRNEKRCPWYDCAMGGQDPVALAISAS